MTATLVAAIRSHGPAKQAARTLGVSPKTAERWGRGENLGALITAARVMSRSRSIADAVLMLAGLDDASLDAEEARLAQQIAEVRARRAARKSPNAVSGPTIREGGADGA